MPAGKSVFSLMRIVAGAVLADIGAFYCLRTRESDGLPSNGAVLPRTKYMDGEEDTARPNPG
jgi:hypothetical protein